MEAAALFSSLLARAQRPWRDALGAAGAAGRASPRPEVASTRYETYEGFHVLRLSGTDYEMGYQHGSLLRQAIARGPVPYFSDFVDRVLVRSLGAFGKPVGRAVGLGLGETVGRRVGSRFPPFVREGLAGLADGAGIPEKQLLRAVTMPDTYLWVLGQYIRRRGYPPAPRLDVPLLGCTSVVAWGGATTDGAMLHGRNFDYQGVGYWDTEPAVVFHRPTKGMPYVAVSAAGVLGGGITGMNAAGLTLVVHQHLASLDFDLGGLPIGVAGDRIMRQAESLDDARRILDEHVPNGAWTYVITSAREQQALCYEVTSRRRAWFHPEGDTFGYTNIYLARELEGREAHAYPAQWVHNAGRYHRARELLAAHRGHLDEERVASFLGDLGDPRCRFQSAISMLQTVASVVFRPADGVVYAAKGRAPVPNNAYVAFDLATEGPRRDLPELTGGMAIPPEARAAFDAYRAGYEAYFNREDLREARRLVDEARRHQPRQAVYHFVAAMLAVGAGELRVAEADLDAAVGLGHPSADRVAGFHLWRGRVRDLRGSREPALADYREAAKGHERLRKAAGEGIAAPWKGRVAIEWNFGDVVLA